MRCWLTSFAACLAVCGSAGAHAQGVFWLNANPEPSAYGSSCYITMEFTNRSSFDLDRFWVDVQFSWSGKVETARLMFEDVPVMRKQEKRHILIEQCPPDLRMRFLRVTMCSAQNVEYTDCLKHLTGRIWGGPSAD